MNKMETHETEAAEAIEDETASMDSETSSTTTKLFINGHIYQDATTRVHNLLVQNDRVAAVNVNPLDFPDASIIDLGANALYPGFCDSHVHLVESALGLSGGNLRACQTPEAIIQQVTTDLKTYDQDHDPDHRYEQEHPGKLLPYFAAGFSLENYNDWRVEHLDQLDAITGSRIALLSDYLGHNLIVNSAAMQQANPPITGESISPPGGEITLQDGQPTGMLREEAMLLAGKTLLPLYPNFLFYKNAKKLMRCWAKKGYTAVVDLMGTPMGRILHPEMCCKMERKGKLPLRVNYKYTFFNLQELRDEPKDLERLPQETDLVRFTGNKFFIDGAYTAGEAWTSWAHTDQGYGLHTIFPAENNPFTTPPANETDYSLYNIYGIVAKLEEMWLDCHYHIQGDVALDMTLDALASAAAKTGGLRCLHTLIHLAFPRPDQIKRIASFNGKVVATMQPAFWKIESGVSQYYADRDSTSYPVKQVIEGGISVGMSTDFSVSSIEESTPTYIMRVAMLPEPNTRTPLSMEDLITGFTQGSAATTGRNDTGTLEPGKKADMVVFNQDLYEVKPEDLSGTNPKVVSTWVSGRLAYEAPLVAGE